MTSILVGSIVFCLIIAAGAYVYWLYRYSRRYTRDRFAFVGLGVLSALALALIHTIAGPTPWEALLASLKWLATGKFEPSQATGEGRTLALLAIAIVAYTIVKL